MSFLLHQHLCLKKWQSDSKVLFWSVQIFKNFKLKSFQKRVLILFAYFLSFIVWNFARFDAFTDGFIFIYGASFTIIAFNTGTQVFFFKRQVFKIEEIILKIFQFYLQLFEFLVLNQQLEHRHSYYPEVSLSK